MHDIVGFRFGTSHSAIFNENKFHYNVIIIQLVNVMLTHSNCIRALLMASASPLAPSLSVREKANIGASVIDRIALLIRLITTVQTEWHCLSQ